jgi:hypothetical protein
LQAESIISIEPHKSVEVISREHCSKAKAKALHKHFEANATFIYKELKCWCITPAFKELDTIQ